MLSNFWTKIELLVRDKGSAIARNERSKVEHTATPPSNPRNKRSEVATRTSAEPGGGVKKAGGDGDRTFDKAEGKRGPRVFAFGETLEFCQSKTPSLYFTGIGVLRSETPGPRRQPWPEILAAQVGFADFRASRQFLRRTRQHKFPGFQHIGTVADAQGHMGVLFNQ